MNLEQSVFRRLVLHNKLANEADIDRLLGSHEHPEQVIRVMVTQGSLKSKLGSQLLELYRRELDKASQQSATRVADRSITLEKKSDDYVLAPPEQIVRRGGASADDDIMSVLLGEERPKSDGSRIARVKSGEGSGVLNARPASSSSGGSSVKLSMGSAIGESRSAAPSEVAAEPLPPTPEPARAPAQPAAPPPAAAAPAAKPRVKVPQVCQADREPIRKLLKVAKELGASDVHVTAGLRPVLRKAQQLVDLDFPAWTPEATQRTLLSLLDETRRERAVEHWDLDFCYEDPTLGRFRANYFYDQSGICGVFRIIPPKVPSFEELRLPDTVRRFTEYRVGIVLVTGPKSCGKTSTLAAMIDHVNRSRREHVITLEDPIEYVHPCKMAHISQREVGQHTQSFSNALRAALREAPDVILVGEMRDLETTSLAITAAETGHLVLASLHTPDSVRTISAVLDVFPPKEQGQIRSMLSESLRGIVSQQLIPSTDGKSLELALEVLVNKSSIANLIREERTYQIRGVMQTGRKDGMVLLDDSLLQLYKAGKISQEEVLTRASDEAYVTKELAGRPVSEE